MNSHMLDLGITIFICCLVILLVILLIYFLSGEYDEEDDEKALTKKESKGVNVPMNEYVEAVAKGIIKEWEIFERVPMEICVEQWGYLQNAIKYYNAKSDCQDRNMEVIYISGGTNRQRTKAAKEKVELERIKNQISEKGVFECYGARSLQGYLGQPIILLGEYKPWGTFGYFKRLTDPHNNFTMKGCRSMKDCTTLVITSAYSLEQFLDCLNGVDESAKQSIEGNISEIVLTDDNIYEAAV